MRPNRKIRMILPADMVAAVRVITPPGVHFGAVYSQSIAYGLEPAIRWMRRLRAAGQLQPRMDHAHCLEVWARIDRDLIADCDVIARDLQIDRYVVIWRAVQFGLPWTQRQLIERTRRRKAQKRDLAQTLRAAWGEGLGKGLSKPE